jgi:hypothetical protein
MLKRGRGGAIEELSVFWRQKVECVFDADIERVFTVVHPRDQTNPVIAKMPVEPEKIL